MKLHEAIEALMLRSNDHMWIRPTVLKGCKKAFCLSYDKQSMEVVPGKRGGTMFMTPYTSLLTADWEIVDPEIVLRGE